MYKEKTTVDEAIAGNAQAGGARRGRGDARQVAGLLVGIDANAQDGVGSLALPAGICLEAAFGEDACDFARGGGVAAEDEIVGPLEVQLTCQFGNGGRDRCQKCVAREHGEGSGGQVAMRRLEQDAGEQGAGIGRVPGAPAPPAPAALLFGNDRQAGWRVGVFGKRGGDGHGAGDGGVIDHRVADGRVRQVVADEGKVKRRIRWVQHCLRVIRMPRRQLMMVWKEMALLNLLYLR